MQSLDPEEFLVDEEDDIFAEGKHIFLAGAILISCKLLPGLGKDLRTVHASWMGWLWRVWIEAPKECKTEWGQGVEWFLHVLLSFLS